MTANLPGAAQAGLHLKRPCLAVVDLARSLTLYRDVLGFKLDYVGEASPQSYLYSVFCFPQQAKLTFAALSTDYEPRALALTEVKGVEIPPPTLPHRLAVIIRVRELESTVATVRQLGLALIEPCSFPGLDQVVFTEQAFCDYDGHLIVLYEATTRG